MKEVGTSESIINQKEFLTKYVTKHPNWLLIDIYIDDGFTGTNFNRPSFIRLKEDIEQGKIDMVITKDLSRLGRDYIDTGYYLEKYFPTKNVRYIAVNDGIDTYSKNSNNDIGPFMSVENDMYAKDISKKVRTVKRTNKEADLRYYTLAEKVMNFLIENGKNTSNDINPLDDETEAPAVDETTEADTAEDAASTEETETTTEE